MCEYDISAFTYKNCTLTQYGRNVQPHKIVTKFIHQCSDPKPTPGSNNTYCDERLHTERINVTDPGDRGHTSATGDCPACKGAEEKSLVVHTIPNPDAVTVKSPSVQPDVQQPIIRNSTPHNQVNERVTMPEGSTNHGTETRRTPQHRSPGGQKSSQTSHAKRKEDNCCNIL